jgi:hypothetical protein
MGVIDYLIFLVLYFVVGSISILVECGLEHAVHSNSQDPWSRPAFNERFKIWIPCDLFFRINRYRAPLN